MDYTEKWKQKINVASGSCIDGAKVSEPRCCSGPGLQTRVSEPNCIDSDFKEQLAIAKKMWEKIKEAAPDEELVRRMEGVLKSVKSIAVELVIYLDAIISSNKVTKVYLLKYFPAYLVEAASILTPVEDVMSIVDSLTKIKGNILSKVAANAYLDYSMESIEEMDDDDKAIVLLEKAFINS